MKKFKGNLELFKDFSENPAFHAVSAPSSFSRGKNKRLLQRAAQSEPDVVQADGRDEDGSQAASVRAEHVGEDLISDEGGTRAGKREPRERLPDSLLKGLARTGNTGNAVFLAEKARSRLVRIGDHAEKNAALPDAAEPWP